MIRYGRVQRRDLGDRTLTTKGDPSEAEYTEVPHLRIISDEDWYAVQELLAAKSTKDGPDGAHPLNSRRRPVYLLTGKVRCGACGEPMALNARKFACTGRNLSGTDCSNSRRVSRVELESAVLRSMSQHLLNPQLLAPFATAYQEEARRKAEERHERVRQACEALASLEARRANLLQSLSVTTPGGFAHGSIIDELEKVSAECDRLQRVQRSSPPPAPALGAVDGIVDKLQSMLPELGEIVSTDQPEAVRARDLLRATIDTVVLTPIPMDRYDARGCGPCTVTINGSLSTLLSLADAEVGRTALSSTFYPSR